MKTYEIFRRFFLLTMAVYLASVAARAADDAKDAEKEPTTVEAKFNELVLMIPETWEKQEPASRLRLGQIGVPAAEGEDEGGELVISSFPGGGGGVDMNIPRWLGEFDGEGRSIKVKTGKAEQGEYAIADLEGTHLGTSFNRRKEPLENARMLVVVIHVKDENYFLKLTGSKKSISEAAAAFRASFGGDAESEKDYEF